MSLKYKQSLRICTLLHIKNHTGTSFFTCQKASLTVEAAIVVPIVAGFLATILFLFRVLLVQATIEEAILYAGRQAAVESSVIEVEEALFLCTELHLLKALEEESVVSDYIKNGIYGVNLLGSSFEGEDILLYTEYEMKLPVAFFGFNSIRLFSTNQFRKWTGDYTNEDGMEWVYITPTGTVYHVDTGCRVLDLSVHAVSIDDIGDERGKNGQSYGICSRCHDIEVKNGWVYCTDYGTVYHKDVSCSSLKRTIERVDKETVGDRSGCSFCVS